MSPNVDEFAFAEFGLYVRSRRTAEQSLTMASGWYYKIGGNVFGPVAAGELKRLYLLGQIQGSTLVQSGDHDGPWRTVGMIEGLLELPSPHSGAVSSSLDSDAAIWQVARSDQTKIGPIPWRDLKALAEHGKLDPSDRVWKPGMALWAPASSIAGLWADSSPAPAAGAGQGLLRLINQIAGSRIRLFGAIAGAVLSLVVLVAGWSWLTSGRSAKRALGGRKLEKPTSTDASTEGSSCSSPHVPDLLDDALSAIRVDQLDRAARLLDQFLPNAQGSRAEAARMLAPSSSWLRRAPRRPRSRRS